MPTIHDSSDEAEFDDGEQVASPSRKRRASRGADVNYNEDADDDDQEEESSDDEDDDIPLASLKSPSPAKKKKTAAKAKPKAKAPATKKKASTKSSTTTSSSTTSSSNSNDFSSPSFALYGKETVKGELIQKLLCRWWYAYTWPDPLSIPKTPPADCDAMDGFPGVYICTQGDEVGTIKDFRDKEKAPSFNKFAKKPSEELKDLLIQAINEQMKQLVEAEGAGTSTEKELTKMLKWASKVNGKKADKDAEKVLKACKLSIPE
jgi:hypothetical protein